MIITYFKHLLLAKIILKLPKVHLITFPFPQLETRDQPVV